MLRWIKHDKEDIGREIIELMRERENMIYIY